MSDKNAERVVLGSTGQTGSVFLTRDEEGDGTVWFCLTDSVNGRSIELAIHQDNVSELIEALERVQD